MENMFFKENVRFLRKLKGISQNEFADILGYKSFTTVQKWEDGTSYPSLPVVSQIADYFHVSVDFLLGREKTALQTERWLDEKYCGKLSNRQLLEQCTQLPKEKRKLLCGILSLMAQEDMT